jgi:hypothetical protein
MLDTRTTTSSLRGRKRPGNAGRALLCILLITLSLFLQGCAALKDVRNEPFGFDYPPADHIKGKAAVVFFVDGLNSDVFRSMLEAGQLPNIQEHFAMRGLYVEQCTSNIPSVTLANETSTVTGVFPGNHNITGINWFDRNRLIWRDYSIIAQKNTLDLDYRRETIFEKLYEPVTVSIFFQAHRGATRFVENWTSAGPPYFFRWYHLVDRISLCRFELVGELSKKIGEFPILTVAYMLAPDMQAYRYGVSSPQYREALLHTDAQIGRVIDDLEKEGIYDKLYLVLTSDHGMTDVGRHLPMEEFLREELHVDVAKKHLWEKTKFDRRLDYYRRFPAVVTGSGERYISLYLRKPVRDWQGNYRFEPWGVKPSPEDLHQYPLKTGRTIDLVERLISEEAVEAVAYATGPDSARIVKKEGIVEIRRPDGRSRAYSYNLIEGNDPLGYERDVPPRMLSGEFFDSREWFEATAGTDFPEVIPQLLVYFDAPRAGDVVLFAAPGWDFGRKRKAGHGSICREEMHFPLIIAGEGIEPERLQSARQVDIVPTLLRLLGHPVDEGLDGMDLFSR